MKEYLFRVFLAGDILINTLLGGDVETMSSRMGRSILAGKKCYLCGILCGMLSMFWPNHCINNIMEPVNKK